MAVIVDTAVESVRTGTADPQTWTHTPTSGVVVRGVLVAATHNVSATDHISAVTYGGETLNRLVRATDTTGEPGAAEWWFLGAGIPQGAQTVSVDLTSATTDDFEFVSIALLATDDIELVDSDSDTGDQANPSAVMTTGGRLCSAFACIFSGQNSPTTGWTMLSGMTAVHNHDYTSQSARVDRQTAPSRSDFTIGWTVASEDVAAVYITLAEVTEHIDFDAFTESIRSDTSDPYEFTHTPLSDPQGVSVSIIHSASDTDFISGVTYGGEALSRVVTAADNADEPGRADIWFLGSGLPTGVQTVSITGQGATDEDFQVVAVTFTSPSDLMVLDSGVVEGDTADPQVALTYSGYMGMAVCALHSGADAGPTGTLLTGMTRMQDHDFGTKVAGTARQTASDTADFTIGYTWPSEDVAFAAAAFRGLGEGDASAEVAAGTGDASNPSITILASIEAASGTGAAANAAPSVAPNAGAAGTGVSNDATITISISGDLAAGSGAASGATGNVAPNAGPAAGVGAAFDATVQVTTSGTDADAELATGTGAAFDATILIGVAAAPALGIGDVLDPSIWINVWPTTAEGLGAAYDAIAGEPPIFDELSATIIISSIGAAITMPGIGSSLVLAAIGATVDVESEVE